MAMVNCLAVSKLMYFQYKVPTPDPAKAVYKFILYVVVLL